MLTSSSEYFKALRDGKYLLFLEWPQFVVEHYKDSDKSNDADDTLNLLVFEWLNNGYSEEDAIKVALLMAVHDLESRPLRASLSYALTAIVSAVLQCMLYMEKNVCTQFLVRDRMSKQRINQLMDGPIHSFYNENFDTLLMEQHNLFFNWVGKVDSAQVEMAYLQIKPITDLRYLVEDYVSDLEISKVPDDEQKSERLSVVRSLSRYLNEQCELGVEVNNKIASYVSKIREMKPVELEDKYLSFLAKPSLEVCSWQMLTSIGISFFNFLQLNQITVIKPASSNAISSNNLSM